MGFWVNELHTGFFFSYQDVVSLAVSILKEGCFYLEYAAKHGYHSKQMKTEETNPRKAMCSSEHGLRLGGCRNWNVRALTKMVSSSSKLSIVTGGRMDSRQKEWGKRRSVTWESFLFLCLFLFLVLFCFPLACQSQKDLNSAPTQDWGQGGPLSGWKLCSLITSWTLPLPPWEPCANTTAWSSCSVAKVLLPSLLFGNVNFGGYVLLPFFFFFKREQICCHKSIPWHRKTRAN